jgi:hypothetical protein
MSKYSVLLSSIVVMLAAAGATLSADKVTLRSGESVSGSFMGADTKGVRLLMANGTITEVPLAGIATVEFTPRKPPAEKAAPPAASAPNPAKAPAPVTIPGGTVLNVLLSEGIDVDAAQAGHTFKSLLDDPVMMNGKVVIPRGSAVALQAAKVEQAGKMKGADKITLKANSIAFGGRKYDVVTTAVEQKGSGEGKKTARKVGGGAGLGAIVGGIAGGGTGAAIGAVAGAATGAIMSSQGTEHLKLPAETRLQFTLNSAVTVQP